MGESAKGAGSADRFAGLKRSLNGIASEVLHVMEEHELTGRLWPEFFREGVMLYPRRSGKALRPALLLSAAEIMGGWSVGALHVGAAVEMFHIFTLIHDDIIDRDDLRRGGPTGHKFFEEVLRRDHPVTAEFSEHLGASLAILGGDVQHAFAVSLITGAARRRLLPAEVALYLLDELEVGVLTPLVEGQVLDLLLSTMPLEDVTEEAIVDMLWKKTGVLFQYSLRAGATIGRGEVEPDHPTIKLFSEIGRLFGIAFQYMDDLLGLIGMEKSFGKPIGSDLIEGKRTAMVAYAYNRASAAQKAFIKQNLGRPELEGSALGELRDLLLELGAAEHARRRVDSLLTQCREAIGKLPALRGRDTLELIVEYAASRER